MLQVRGHLAAAGDAASDTDPAVKPLINRMLSQFNYRFGDGSVEKLPVKMMLAAAADPRTKDLAWLSPADQVLVWAEFAAFLVQILDAADAAAAAEILKAQAASSIAPAIVKPSADSDEDELGDDPTDMFAGLSGPQAHNAADSTAPKAVTNAEAVAHQLHVYRQLPTLRHSEKIPGNPLQWWQQHESRAPVVAEGGRRLLCVPATSASSERVFSTAGQVVQDKRTALKPENAGRLVFIKGCWEVVSKATAAAAESTATTVKPASSSSAVRSSSSSKAVSSAPAKAPSATEKEDQLNFSAGNLKEGSLATMWSTGGTGRGDGVPRRGMSIYDNRPVLVAHITWPHG